MSKKMAASFEKQLSKRLRLALKRLGVEDASSLRALGYREAFRQLVADEREWLEYEVIIALCAAAAEKDSEDLSKRVWSELGVCFEYARVDEIRKSTGSSIAEALDVRTDEVTQYLKELMKNAPHPESDRELWQSYVDDGDADAYLEEMRQAGRKPAQWMLDALASRKRT